MELEFLLKFSRGGDAIYKTRILLPNIIAHHLQQSLFTHGYTRRKMERGRGRERGREDGIIKKAIVPLFTLDLNCSW
jgi:hypothetical protein